MPSSVLLAQFPLWMALGPDVKVALGGSVPPGVGITVAGYYHGWV